MNLETVEISNYRSIKYAKLQFGIRCRALVGMNEAGKTNILKALSLIDPEISATADDERLPSPDEPIDSSSVIDYIFAFDNSDKQALYKRIKTKIALFKDDELILKRGDGNLTLENITSNISNSLYTIDIPNEEKTARYYRFPAADKLAVPFQKPTSAAPEDFMIPSGTHKGLPLKKVVIISKTACDGIPDAYLQEVQVAQLHQLLGSEITLFTKTNLPRAVYWSYKEENLIPASLDIAQFRSAPDICKPLKNAFRLAGITNINEELEKATTRPTGTRNLLDRVAKRATKHIQKIWPEYKSIEIDIRQNGSSLETGVKDKYNLFDFSRRSDGFKRFISFLLMLSAPSETGELANVLILIDDPDVGLHPSGTRYLRDELSKIAEKNIVVFSSHSIFMIDKQNINKHLIVKKTNEVTTLEEANHTNIIDEEVLYNALGFTFLDILSENNIIFEGWRDKRLFTVALNGKKSLAKGHQILKKVGFCHAQGVKDIKNIAPMMELARRKCLIVSDSDKPAHEKRKDHRESKTYGLWLTYEELVNSEKIATAEDFITDAHFVACIRSLNVSDITNGPNFEDFQLKEPVNKLKQLSDWLSGNSVAKNQKTIIENALKEKIFGDLSYSNIRPIINEALDSITETFT